MLVLPAMNIMIPSSFAIVLDSATDNNGSPVDLEHTYLHFVFYSNSKKYECLSDPERDDFMNAKIVNGELWLLFENYPFDSTGFLSYTQHERSSDSHFQSGYSDTWSDIQQTKIRLVR